MTNALDFNILENRRKQIIKQNKNGLVKGLIYLGSIFFLGIILSSIIGFFEVVLFVAAFFLILAIYFYEIMCKN